MLGELWGLEEIQSRSRFNPGQRFFSSWHKNIIVAVAGWWFSTRLVVVFSLQKEHFISLQEELLLSRNLMKVTYFCLYQAGKWKAALQGSSLGVSVFLSQRLKQWNWPVLSSANCTRFAAAGWKTSLSAGDPSCIMRRQSMPSKTCAGKWKTNMSAFLTLICSSI